jgi:hypothetical protein
MLVTKQESGEQFETALWKGENRSSKKGVIIGNGYIRVIPWIRMFESTLITRGGAEMRFLRARAAGEPTKFETKQPQKNETVCQRT